MASFLAGIFRTPKKDRQTSAEPTGEALSAESALPPSPSPTTKLGRNSQGQKRKRSSTDALREREDSGDAQDLKAPERYDAAAGEVDVDNDTDGELWTIKSISNHRWVDDSIDLEIQWDRGEPTWEPEVSIQEDAPSMLFAYWAKVGGRPSHPSDPDLFHIFAIRQAKGQGKKLLVEWVGYKERSWEPRGTVEEAAPEMLEEFESRQSELRKRRRKT